MAFAKAAAMEVEVGGEAGEAGVGGAKKLKRGAEDRTDPKGGSSTGGVHARLMHQMDYRIRIMEGHIPTFFLAQNDTVLLPAMQAGEKVYTKKTPEKGQPHPLGAKRLQLGATLLNCVASMDIKKYEGVEKGEDRIL